MRAIDEVADCFCPACLAELDPAPRIDGILAVAAELSATEDPMVAELAAATLVPSRAESVEDKLVGTLIPDVEARGNAGALALLLAIRSVAPDRARKAAGVAADRLVDAGVAPPAWVAELDAPVTVSGCRRIADSAGCSTLACTFERAGRAHAVTVAVDEGDTGAATDISLLAPDDLARSLERMRSAARGLGLRLTTTRLGAAEFRWHVERALDARAALDRQVTAGEPDGPDGPNYPALAALLRARIEALPMAERPAAAAAKAPVRAGNRIYQLKITLRGAKPASWRRVEVPADLDLARLHLVIQDAFGWGGEHLYAFDTFLGEFGPAADAELGLRPDRSIRLAQVAPDVSSRFRYTYDFGDDWQHEIVVEKVFDGR